MVNAINITSKSPIGSGIPLQFRAYAVNGVGVGAFSQVFTVISDSVPLFMNAPAIAHADINPQWIYITWTGITGDEQTGGDPASFYGLEWDQGKDTWVNVTTPSLGLILSFNLTSTSPFGSAVTFKFRTYAKNGVGYGAYSDVTQIVTDSVPLFMN